MIPRGGCSMIERGRPIQSKIDRVKSFEQDLDQTTTDDTSSIIPGAFRVENFHYIEDYRRFLNTNDFLNKYLIFCFMHKMIDRIKSIIIHLNLDTTANTRVKYIYSSIYDKSCITLEIKVSFLWIGVFCNDINFVKFILEKNGKYDSEANKLFLFIIF